MDKNETANKMSKPEHTPKGRSQKFYREDKGLLGGKWPKKPIKMASSDGKKHFGQ